MLEGLVVTEIVPQRLLELGHGREETIVGGASPEHLPEPLDHLQLGTIAGEGVQLQMREGPQHCGDYGASVPGGFVDHDHDAGILRSRVGPCDVAHMASKRLLHIALRRPPRRAGALYNAGRQASRHQVQGTEDVEHVVTIQIAHHGAMPFNAQGSPERRHHRKARLILTQQDEVTGGGFFLRFPGLGELLPAGPDRL